MGETPEQLLKRYSSQTPSKSGVWGNVVGVSNFNEADYYIVLDGYPKILPQDKTIFVKREPNFINPRTPNYQHTIHWNETNCGITWWVNKSYDELKAMGYPPKPKKISCVVSSKHFHRNNYVKSLFKDNSPIELYGKGHNGKYYGENYKGPLTYDGKCKLRGLIDYEYSIALENSQQKNYWTEKLADTYLSWCLPIYWGCPNLPDFFPKNSYHLIDIKNNNSLQQIEEIIKQPIDIEALTEARNMVLDEYNIWEVINKKIKKI